MQEMGLCAKACLMPLQLPRYPVSFPPLLQVVALGYWKKLFIESSDPAVCPSLGLLFASMTELPLPWFRGYFLTEDEVKMSPN